MTREEVTLYFFCHIPSICEWIMLKSYFEYWIMLKSYFEYYCIILLSVQNALTRISLNAHKDEVVEVP